MELIPKSQSSSIYRMGAGLKKIHRRVKYIHYSGKIELALKLFCQVKSSNLVHAHGPLASIFVYFLHKGDYFITAHEFTYDYLRLCHSKIYSEILNFFYKISINKAKYVIVPSISLARYYESNYHVKANVISNFLDKKNFFPVNYKPVSGLAIIGSNLLAVKGIDKVLEFNRLYPHINIHIFGVDKSIIVNLINRKNKNIHIHGYLEFNEIQKFMSDNKLIPAIFSRTESFSLVTLDLASNGFPLIVNDLPVFDEYLPRNLYFRFNINDLNSIFKAYSDALEVDVVMLGFNAKILSNKYTLKNYVESYQNLLCRI